MKRSQIEISEDLLTMVLWFIIGIFWVIAQVVQRLRGTPPGEDPVDEEDEEGELDRPTLAETYAELNRKFRESMTGNLPEEEPATPAARTLREEPEEAPPAEPVFIPSPQPPKPAPVVGEVHDGAYEISRAFEPLQDIPDLEEMVEMEEMHFEIGETTANIVGPNHLLVGLGALRMPLQRIPIHTVDTAIVVKIKPPPLRGAANLRNAMLSRVILGPPKALRNELEDLRDPSRA